MAKYRVPLYKTPGKSAVIDTEAGTSSSSTTTATSTSTPTVTQGNASVHAVLSNPISTIATHPDGTGGDFSTAVGTCYVFNGDEDVTGLNDAVNGPVYSLVGTTAGMTATIDPVTGAYSASLDDTHDTGEADFKVVYGSTAMHIAFTVIKNKNGKSVILRADAAGFTYQNGSPSPTSQTVTIKATTTNLSGSVAWSSSPNVTLGVTGDTAILTAADFDAGGADQVTISATLGGITDYLVLVRLTPTATDTPDPIITTPGNVTNPGFEAGDVGWDKNGWTIVEDAANAGHGSWYATITGSANPITNQNRMPVSVGSVVRVHCRFKSDSGASGTGYVGIAWYDSTDTLINRDWTDATHLNKWVTGPSTSYDTAHIHAIAPANTAYASLTAYVNACSGKWYLDDCNMFSLPFHLGEVGDDPVGKRNAVLEIDANRRPFIDFAQTGHLYKNTDNIAETGNNLHLKPALQTQLGQNSQSANLLYNWEFRNTDFWAPGNNITVPSPGVMQFSWSANNSGGTQYTTVPQVDERNNTRHFAVKAGDILTIEADARLVSGATPSSFYVVSALIDAAASAHYTGLQANLYTANITSSFQTIKGTFAIPSTVGSGGPAPAYIGFTFGVVLSNGKGGGTVEWRRPRVAINHQTLTDSGGAQLGSGLNLFSLNSAGYATAYWTGVSFTPGPGSMAVSAGTLHVGGESVSYNSSSISGQGYSTTYSYFYQDKGYAGGSQTLQATTSKQSLIGNDGNLYIGDATTQSSGGTGGSGTIPSCLALDMFIRPNVPAVMACVGQKFDAYDKFTALGERTLLNAWTATGAAVRITTSNGSVLDCGEDTPFDLKDGTSKLAKDMLGETVITDGGEDTVTSVTSIGVIPLMYVSGAGVSIMAGAAPTKRVASHNAQKQ